MTNPKFCPISGEEHLDARDEIDAFLSKMDIMLMEFKESHFVTYEEETLLRKAFEKMQERSRNLRDHAYKIHGVQRQTI